jgi:hypothetical protein
MKKFLPLLPALAFLFACQKEIDGDFLNRFDLSKLLGKTWTDDNNTPYPGATLKFYSDDTGTYSAITWFNPPTVLYTDYPFTWQFREPDTLNMTMSTGFFQYNIIGLEDSTLLLRPAVAGATDTIRYMAR